MFFKKNKKEKKPELQDEVVWPENIEIGFKNKEETINWSTEDWLNFFKEESEKKFTNPLLSSIHIKDTEYGVWYELQEKSQGKGFLLGVMEKLEEKKSVILPAILSGNKYAQVSISDKGVITEYLDITEEQEHLDIADSISVDGNLVLIENLLMEEIKRLPIAEEDVENKVIDKKSKKKIKKKTKKKYQELDGDTIKAGERLIEELEQEEEEIFPKNIMIGFIEAKRKKDLVIALRDLNEKNFEFTKTTTFHAIKYNRGFIYEMHERGNGKGFLTNILTKLEHDGEVILPVEIDRYVKVIKDKHAIDTIRLPEKEDIKADFTERNDKMDLLIKPNVILYRFGILCFMLGIMALAVSLTVKYIIIDVNKELVYPERNYNTPFEAASSEQMNVQRTERIMKMEYRNGRWFYEKEDVRDLQREQRAQRAREEEERAAEESINNIEELDNIEDMNN